MRIIMEMSLILLTIMTVTSMQLFPKDFFKRFIGLKMGKFSQSPKITFQECPECQENNQTSSEIIMSTLPPIRRRLPSMASPHIDRIDDLVEAAYQKRFNDLKRAAAKKKKETRRLGSEDFLPGIVNSIVGASGGLSSGSSGGSNSSPTYGEPQPMFNILDFKKAILNTLIQALKAITGGVIGIAGKVVKTGGFVVLTKGRFISSTGDAISSFGAQLTRGALITAPKHQYGPPKYSYHPQQTGDVSFNDRPPIMNEVYSEHHNYHPGN